MLIRCETCNATGVTMRRCKKCGQVYCRSCATKGRITGKPVPLGKCPYCGAYQNEQAR